MRAAAGQDNPWHFQPRQPQSVSSTRHNNIKYYARTNEIARRQCRKIDTKISTLLCFLIRWEITLNVLNEASKESYKSWVTGRIGETQILLMTDQTLVVVRDALRLLCNNLRSCADVKLWRWKKTKYNYLQKMRPE